MPGSDWFGLTAEYPATTTPWVFSENSQRKPISVETQMVFSIRLETLFQLNNVVPFSLGNSNGFWLVRHGKHPSFRLHFLYLVYQCRWGQPRHFLHPPRFPGYACLSLVFYATHALFTPTSLAKPSLPKWWLVKENWRTGFYIEFK